MEWTKLFEVKVRKKTTEEKSGNGRNLVNENLDNSGKWIDPSTEVASSITGTLCF